jgi:hypothetical protein
MHRQLRLFGVFAVLTLGLAALPMLRAAAETVLAPNETEANSHAAWHPPTDHEHGDAPPQWVLDSSWQPFTQSRESHRGYKGVLGRMANGVESYLIAHIISTAEARSHGDHDYQVWVKEPDGTVSHWGRAGATDTSVLDYGHPPLLLSGKTDDRPSIQEVNNNEAWYPPNKGTAVVDVAWVIFGPNEPFNDDVAAGDGTLRSAAWRVHTELFPGPDAAFVSPTLIQFCEPSPKGCDLRFLVDRHNNAPGLARMTLPN